MGKIAYVRSRRFEEIVKVLVESLGLEHVRVERVYCSVSFNARTRAYARIWGVPGPFVKLGICEPAYVIEFVYENLVDVPCKRLLGVIIHELLHIPRGFTGGLRRHGEWSRWSNIVSIVEKLPIDKRRHLCSEARRALEEARRVFMEGPVY